MMTTNNKKMAQVLNAADIIKAGKIPVRSYLCAMGENGLYQIIGVPGLFTKEEAQAYLDQRVPVDGGTHIMFNEIKSYE